MGTRASRGGGERGGRRRGLGGRIGREFLKIGPWRLIASAAFIVLGLVIARFGWSIPLAAGAERALYDVRATATAPTVDQDPRIDLVVYAPETLEATRKRSPLDRGLLARALRRIDALHPKAIGIDILIDQAQPDDEALVAALASLRTPTWLAFLSSKPDTKYMAPWQEQFLRRLIARLAGSHVQFASVGMDPDPGGAVRRWPRQPPGLPPPLALAMSGDPAKFHHYTGGVVFRQPLLAQTDVYASVPIDPFGYDGPPDEMKRNLLAGQSRLIPGRYILIGADVADFDRFTTPATTLTGDDLAGIQVHAAMLAQALDGRVLAPIPPWTLWVAAILVVLAGAVTGVADIRGRWFPLALAAELAALITVPFALQRLGVDTLTLPMFSWIVGWIVASAAIAAAARAIGAEQRQFAQATLGKYLPRDIAREILRDPDRLTLSGEKREIYAVFTDLEGFTKFSHLIEPEMVAQLVNGYLDALSEVVLAHGGTLDKFVGDAVVAFWGAPIARPDDADRAVRAAIALHQAGEIFRASTPEGAPPLGRTRVGLHRGPAIVGNFGGEGRIQYTAFGDSMNTASRLESANKQLKSSVLISAAAAEQTSVGGLRPLGRVILRGRATPIEVFEPKPDFPGSARARLNDAYARFDAGDVGALNHIDALAAEFPDDAALENLVARLKEVGPGGAFVLA